MEVEPSNSTQEAENEGAAPVRGMPKSGRWWKETKKPKNTINKVKPLHSSWEKKMTQRAQKAQVKLLQQEIRDKLTQEKQDKIERKKEHEERRKENARKAEIVQVIRKTEKLKKMKKKQLRKVEKRDVT
ncbi:unnamed protein product, partial [Mesorhabditis belari]|uniref:Coiled-coil domain-containing protein 86 n=1 Tax=Mesorhabditis belari TaxID=2138241 RepID=A0AAF3ECS4_9BILA